VSARDVLGPLANRLRAVQRGEHRPACLAAAADAVRAELPVDTLPRSSGALAQSLQVTGDADGVRVEFGAKHAIYQPAVRELLQGLGAQAPAAAEAYRAGLRDAVEGR
jgi:hypothetical protein